MRWLLAPLMALLWLTGSGAAARTVNPEVWFNPHVPLDWMDMWSDTAPWQHAARRVQVLEIVHWWLNTATDAQILAMTDFAKRHHMKIDLEIEAVPRDPALSCGNIEGYTTPGDLTAQAAILKRLNVQVDIMTMDEPVWFGHYDPEPQDCAFSATDLATRVASNISGVIALYPDIQIHEIETLPGVTNFPDWRSTLSTFRAALNRATGKPIRSIQLDVDWGTPGWIPALQAMHTFVHEQNMGLGIILDASGNVRSDAEWIASAQHNFEYFEGTLGIIPDEVIFTSWQPYPVYNMPETSPTAQTWLIDNYFRLRTLLQASFTGRGVQGKLTTESGKPIPNATINGYVPGVDFAIPLPATVIQEVVPANAARGLLGIRLNTECNCQGINDILVGTLQYQETLGGSSSYSFQYPPVRALFNGAIVDGEWVGGTKVTRVITTAAQSFYPNSGIFPVTAGAHYTLTFPSSTIGGEGWYGNVFLLWLDTNGSPITRVTVVPGPGKRLVSTAITAADGSFHLPALPRVGPGSAPVTVEFAGDATYRAVGWSPLH